MKKFIQLSSSFYSKLKIQIKESYKIIITLITIIIILFSSFQFYNFYQNKNILKISQSYNLAKSSKSPSEFLEIMNKIAQQKNFFGTLSKLELINNKNDEYTSLYNDYLSLLNNSNLDSLFKSAIAVKGSYSLLDKITVVNKDEILMYINNLINFIDSSLEFYEGFKLEILYLSLIVEKNYSLKSNTLEKINNLYKQIIENDKISPSIKDRIKKIHVYEIYN